MDDVERAGGDIVAPHQVDQLACADRRADPGQEQGQQVGLLPRTDIQFDTVAPQPQRAEDLEANARTAGTRVVTVRRDGWDWQGHADPRNDMTVCRLADLERCAVTCEPSGPEPIRKPSASRASEL